MNGKRMMLLMATNRIPSSGGLSENTRLFLSNGTLIDITKLKSGDRLLSAEGKASEVERVVQFTGNLVKVTRKFQHEKEGFEEGYIPDGVVTFIVSDRHELLLETKQRVKKSIRKPKHGSMRVIEITELRSKPLSGLDLLLRPMTGSTSFPLATDIAVIKRHIKEKTSESIDGYCAVPGQKYISCEQRIKVVHQGTSEPHKFGNLGVETVDGQMVWGRCDI